MLVTLAGAAAQTPADLVRVEASEEAMGTTFSVVAYGRERAATEAAARSALHEAVRLDALLSNYKADSEWSTMNRVAAETDFVASAELFDLVSASLTYSRATEGAFDITVGPLMKAWGFYKDEGSLPGSDAVAAALANVGWRLVHVDPATRQVRFARGGVELDPGGIGKGYAIDRMASALRTAGVTSAFVSAGGSSVYGLGAPPDEPRGWRAAIRHPRQPGRVAADVFLQDMSLSTSGSYEKFFRANGREYSHIMDPRTGYPARGTSSVSVLAPRTIDSEAWTKAYFVHGAAWAARHIRPGTRVFMCDDGPAPRCRWIVR